MKKRDRQIIIKNACDNLRILNEMAESDLFPDKELYVPIINKIKELKLEYTMHESKDALIQLENLDLKIQFILNRMDFCVREFMELNEEIKDKTEVTV